jgi:hypothetical protein
LAVLLVACSPTQPADSVAPDAPVEFPNECSPVELRAPSGTIVDLTGTWQANDLGVYDLRQLGSCVYWTGKSSPLPGLEAGAEWTNVFVGNVRSDFTIVGRWADVRSSGTMQAGGLTLHIDFDVSGEVEHPVLRLVEESGGAFGGQVWVLEESLPGPIDLQGILGGTAVDGCIWIDSDGERYELLGGGGEWITRAMPVSVQTSDGRIVARLGDQIRVRGRPAALLGNGCTEQVILVDELDPTP